MKPAEKLKHMAQSLTASAVLFSLSSLGNVRLPDKGVDFTFTMGDLKTLFLNLAYHGGIFKEVWANKAFSQEERAAAYQNLMTAIAEVEALFEKPEARNDISD